MRKPAHNQKQAPSMQASNGEKEALIERLLEKSTLDYHCCGKDFFVSQKP